MANIVCNPINISIPATASFNVAGDVEYCGVETLAGDTEFYFTDYTDFSYTATVPPFTPQNLVLRIQKDYYHEPEASLFETDLRFTIQNGNEASVRLEFVDTFGVTTEGVYANGVWELPSGLKPYISGTLGSSEDTQDAIVVGSLNIVRQADGVILDSKYLDIRLHGNGFNTWLPSACRDAGEWVEIEMPVSGGWRSAYLQGWADNGEHIASVALRSDNNDFVRMYVVGSLGTEWVNPEPMFIVQNGCSETQLPLFEMAVVDMTAIFGGVPYTINSHPSQMDMNTFEPTEWHDVTDCMLRDLHIQFDAPPTMSLKFEPTVTLYIRRKADNSIISKKAFTLNVNAQY